APDLPQRRPDRPAVHAAGVVRPGADRVARLRHAGRRQPDPGRTDGDRPRGRRAPGGAGRSGGPGRGAPAPPGRRAPAPGDGAPRAGQGGAALLLGPGRGPAGVDLSAGGAPGRPAGPRPGVRGAMIDTSWPAGPAPLDYRYALDAAMPALAGAGPPLVLCNVPELEHEVRQRVAP